MTSDKLVKIREDMNERLLEATSLADESSKVAMNSYGAGYDRGLVDGLTEAILKLKDVR